MKNVQKGFTVAEVLVAIVLGTIVISIMATSLQVLTITNARASQRSEAEALTFQKIQDYINLPFEDVPIGDSINAYEVENFDADAEAINLLNPEGRVYVEPASVVPEPTTTTNQYVEAVTADASYSSGGEINQTGTDRTDYWYYSNRIADGSYNNSYTYATDDDNVASPSIDLGSPRDVDTIRVSWWYCDYAADSFAIQAKNGSPTSSSGWTTIVGGLSADSIACSGSDNRQDINVSGNSTAYQHWRVYIYQSNHYYYSVISELEALSADIPGDIVEQRSASASSNPGGLDYSDATLDMTENGSAGQQSIGLKFDEIDVPQGATITNAYINFVARSSDSSSVTLRVRGVDADTSPEWVGAYAVDRAIDSNSSDGYVGTSASQTWSPPAWSSGENGPDTRVDVTSIVQEITDRPGWDRDHDMSFGITRVSGSGKRRANRTPSPQLVIEWQETTEEVTGGYIDADGDGDVDNPNLLRVTSVLEYDSLGTRERVMYSTLMRRYGVGD